MKDLSETIRNIAMIAAGTIMIVNSVTAQAPVQLFETWDAPPTLASVPTAGAWYPDRYRPAVFEQFMFSGENVLRVGIRATDALAVRPPANRSTFYNTHGRKYDLGAGNGPGTALVADLYVGADWDVKHRMATLWSTARDSTGATAFYNIVGFRNVTGTDPGFYMYGYRNVGAYTLVPYPVSYGQWYQLKIALTDTAFVYSINNTVVLSDTTLNGARYFSDLMLQAYSFADSSLPVATQAYDEYDVYWDNVGTVLRPTVFGNPIPVVMQSSAEFRVLAGTAVTISAGTTVGGDVGVSPGTAVTNSGTVNGTIHSNDVAAVQAQADLAWAYQDASERSADTTVGTELGGMTFGRGVYVSASGTFGITGTLTLSGSENDIFIFKMASTLLSARGSRVILTGGARASNVTWQVGSSATIGGEFAGSILAFTAITLQTGSSIDGQALAQHSFVTLNGLSTTPVEVVEPVRPQGYALLQNYPNPFNPSTTISFTLPSAAMTVLAIYDVMGRQVSIVVSEDLSAGTHARQWNAAGVPAGVYYYRLIAGGFTETRKLVLLQ